MLVTGYDDRFGCGYVLRTGADITEAPPGGQLVEHDGTAVLVTPELAALLRDALVSRPIALLSWSGPEVALTLDDATVLGWLTHTVGGVVTVRGGPG